MFLGQPSGFPPKIPHPPPKDGARPGAAQGWVVLAHLALHWSNFLAFGFRKLVTGPIPLNSSPQPPVYAWSVSQDLADHTFRGDVEEEEEEEDQDEDNSGW